MSRLDKYSSPAMKRSTHAVPYYSQIVSWTGREPLIPVRKDSQVIGAFELMQFVILPLTVTELEWISMSTVPAKTQTGTPCSRERVISSYYSLPPGPFPLSSLLCPTLPPTLLPAAVPLACAARLSVPHSLCRTPAFPWCISLPERLHWLVESGRGVAIATALILNFSLLDVTENWSVARGQPRTQINGFFFGVDKVRGVGCY